jgi:hypothetical protein
MSIKNLAAAGLIAMFTLCSFAATAADVEVTCEKRSSRSRASVDGSGLAPGSYRAVLKSGGKTSRSPYAAAIDDEAEFDFDSNPADIAEGATPISAAFIVDGRVKGYLVNESNQRVTPIVEAICRVRR